MTRPRFVDTHVFRAERFSLGIDETSGGYFLSTPISGAMHAVDFEGYFSLSAGEYRTFADDPAAAAAFTEDCRMGRHAHRRIA